MHNYYKVAMVTLLLALTRTISSGSRSNFMTMRLENGVMNEEGKELTFSMIVTVRLLGENAKNQEESISEKQERNV